MKRFLKVISIIIVIIFLICLIQKLGILDFSVFNVNEEKLASYNEYYFSRLEQAEQEMYMRVDEALKNRKEKVAIATYDSTNLTDKVTKVLTAYFYDNPEYYYISNEYTIYTTDFKVFQYTTINLNYIIKDKAMIEAQNLQMESAIDEILRENIKEGMTRFEMEVALHDALIERVSYYKYEDINKIPAIKHTAYGALVEKQAVCDGYSKAFKILLDRAGIENIIVSGTAKNVAHAWNIVKLGDEYYHVDVTSDKLEYGSNRYAVHTYFNITDEEILKTHTIDEEFERPQCNSIQFDYYTQNGYYIDYDEHLDRKLRDIISKQNNSGILEVEVDERYKARRIIDMLYELDFNNWRTNGKTSIEYNKVDNIYVFVK